MQTKLNYQALETLIHNQHWWFDASELQGILTGLICCQQEALWSALLFAHELDNSSHQALFERLNQTLEQALAADSLRYQLLLPSDGSLSARAIALTQWCKGMVMAVNYVKQQSPLKLDQDSLEFMQDLNSIIELDTQLSDDETNQRHLNQLEEHCRMGALLLFADVHRQKKPNK